MEGNDAGARLAALPLRTRKRLVHNIRELVYALGHFLSVLTNIAGRTRNKNLQDLATHYLNEYLAVTAQNPSAKLSRMRNTVSFALLSLSVIRGESQLDLLTQFHDLQAALLRETVQAHTLYLRSGRREKELSLFRDSLTRSACNSFNLATYLVKRGKFKASFARLEVIRTLLPLLESRAAEFFKAAGEFFVSSFDGLHEELLELEEILAEFGLTGGSAPAQDTPNFDKENVYSFAKTGKNAFDPRGFALQNQLVVAALRKKISAEQLEAAEIVESAQVENTLLHAPQRIPSNHKRQTVQQSWQLRSSQRTHTRSVALTEGEKVVQLTPLNASAGLMDNYFQHAIDAKINVCFGQESLMRFTSESQKQASRGKQLSVLCSEELRMRHKEQLQPYREYFFRSNEHQLEQLKLVCEVGQKQSALSRTTKPTLSKLEWKPEKPKTLKEFVLARKLVRASNIEKLRQAYIRIPQFGEIPAYDHNEALRSSKEIIKANLEERERRNLLIRRREKTIHARAAGLSAYPDKLPNQSCEAQRAQQLGEDRFFSARTAIRRAGQKS